MNREIKFRAWDEDNKVFDYFSFNNLDDIIEKLDTFMDYFSSNYFSRPEEETGNSKLQQFTGLKDKNGKEIYEGDIVMVCFATGKENCEIVEEKGCYWVSQKRTDYIKYMAHDNLYWHIDGCEVIGNIFENPELLNHP